jgi:hypothetical protein
MAINFSISFDTTKLKTKLQNLKGIRDVAMPLLYQKFKDTTPVRTGNARDHTMYHSNIIKADYDYADALDRGRSPKAPEGMSKPTLETAKVLIPQLIKRIGAK